MKNPRHSTTNFRMLRPFLDAVDATENRCLRFESSQYIGYMPLSLEYLHYQDEQGRPVYSLMHFSVQNGDLMRDPDVTFSVDRKAGTIHPLTYQNDFMGVYHEVYHRQKDGALVCYQRLLTSIDDLLWQWLRNIHRQGFLPEKGEYHG